MIRLLTLNLQHAKPGAGALSHPALAHLAGSEVPDPADARMVLQVLADQIQRINPDVVALQEVDFGQARSGRLNQAEELAAALGWQYWRAGATYVGPVAGLRRRPRRSALTSHDDDPLGLLRHLAGLPPAGFGNALLSRIPVAGWALQRLGRGPALITTSPAAPAWNPRHYRVSLPTARNHLVATLEVPAQRLSEEVSAQAPLSLHIGCVHLATRTDVASRQLAAAWSALAQRPGLHLMAGDLNLRAQAVASLGIARALGEGPTYPAGQPRHRIDHVLTDPWPLAPTGIPVCPPASTAPGADQPVPPADAGASSRPDQPSQPGRAGHQASSAQAPQPTEPAQRPDLTAPVLRARAWGRRTLVVSDHAATWVDVDVVDAAAGTGAAW